MYGPVILIMDEIKILLVEDEKKIAAALKTGMEELGFYVMIAYDTAWVAITIKPDKKIIRIKDEGIGMTQVEVQKIFEPFFRSQKAETISAGLGLGLSMSSGIIRLHKGEIHIEIGSG